MCTWTVCRYMIPRYTDVEQFFSINSEDGMITTTRRLDRESQAWHNISVSATEIGTTSLPHINHKLCTDLMTTGTVFKIFSAIVMEATDIRWRTKVRISKQMGKSQFPGIRSPACQTAELLHNILCSECGSKLLHLICFPDGWEALKTSALDKMD